METKTISVSEVKRLGKPVTIQDIFPIWERLYNTLIPIETYLYLLKNPEYRFTVVPIMRKLGFDITLEGIKKRAARARKILDELLEYI